MHIMTKDGWRDLFAKIPSLNEKPKRDWHWPNYVPSAEELAAWADGVPGPTDDWKKIGFFDRTKV